MQPVTAPSLAADQTVSPMGDTDSRLAEADHRIGNNLAMLGGLVRMHARRVGRDEGALDRAEVVRLLDDVAGRIQTIGRLHKLLAHAVRREGLELQVLLTDICASVTSSIATTGKLSLTCDIADDCLLQPDAALSLGLIFCELVTNSMKYAHPSGLPVAVSVRCGQTGERTTFEYADDGVGLPEGFDPQVDGGIGLLLVRSRAEQLNAEYRFDDDCLGLRFHLDIPKGHPQALSAE